MNKEFEKIIEKLEEEKSGLTEWAEDEAFKLAIDKAIEIVKQEAEKYNNGWIPCSERLPEESLQSVMGWDEYREQICFVHFIRGRFILGDDTDSVNIIAWQPLPAPYQPKEEV